MRCVLHHGVSGERYSCGDKTRQHRRWRFLWRVFYFSSLITLKQISENYDNEFNSVQLPSSPETKKQQDPTVLLFCISVWLLKWRQCEKSCELRDYEIWYDLQKKKKNIYKLVTRVLCCGILTVSGCHQDETPTQWGGRGGVVIKRVGWELDFICKRRLQGRSDAKHICASSVHTRVSIVCQQGNIKTTERISMKLGWKTGPGQE